MSELPEAGDELELTVEHVVVVTPRDERKGYYGPDVELLLMSDGTVKWRYEGDD